MLIVVSLNDLQSKIRLPSNQQTCSIGKSPKGKSRKPVIFKKLIWNSINPINKNVRSYMKIMWSISLLSYTFKHQNMHYIKIAYLISSLFVILSSKLYWLAKVSHLQKFKIISITPKFRYDILSCTAPK